MFDVVKHAFQDWMEDDCPQMAASLAYYTIFSLPPLLIIVLAVTGVFVDPAQVEGQIQSQLRDLLGAGAADQIQQMIRSASRPGTGGPLVLALSVAGLLFGATGAFAQLQKALNRAWEVAPDPEKAGVLSTVTRRIVSLGMVLTIAFLLLVSMVLTAAVSSFGSSIAELLPGGLSSVFLQVLQLGLSLAVITVLFALMFKVLPDARVEWEDVWVGAFVTSLLFVAGQFLLGLYFARSDPGQAFGAAGALALILVWIYYAGLILFFGAEFTQARAVEKGGGIRPSKDAVRMEYQQKVPRRPRRERAGARAGD